MKIIALIISIFTMSFTPIQNLEKRQSLEFNVETKGSKSFAGFLSHFDKVEFPEDIDHTKIQDYKATYLSNSQNLTRAYYDSQNDVKNYIPESVGSKFSRIGPPIVIPLKRFYTDENTIAVTYLVRYPFGFSDFTVKLSLFDLMGNNKLRKPKSKSKSKSKRNGSIMIASFDVEKTMLCSFNDASTVSITTYKNNWEKELSEFGIEDNSISNYDRLKSEVYSINLNGAVDIKTLKPSYAGIK